MEMWYYRYTIELWDKDEGTSDIQSGITAGTSIKEAFDRIWEYYGDDIINITHFTPISDTVLELNKDNCIME